MQDRDTYRNSPSILASLQNLPEVIEKNSESSWQMFVALQSQGDSFSPTQPSDMQALSASNGSAEGRITVQDAMAEARRLNRVSPCAADWKTLYLLLKSAGTGEPPLPMTGNEASATPALVRRTRVRDQVEWAAQHGVLDRVFHFFQSLPENRWVHIGQ